MADPYVDAVYLVILQLVSEPWLNLVIITKPINFC